MIPVSRLPEPSSLRENATQWTIELLDLLEAIESTPDETTRTQLKNESKQLQSHYKQTDVKSVLGEMFAGKCAYCESRIGTVSYPDIEHFYPKSKYPEKTFLWTNLLHACEKCNRTYKRDRFPLDEQGEPLLIDPTAPNLQLNLHLEFIWDAQAGMTLISGRDAKGQTTVELFGLNHRQDLLEERTNLIKRLMPLLSYAKDGNGEAQAILHALAQESPPYMAFIRQYILAHL